MYSLQLYTSTVILGCSTILSRRIKQVYFIYFVHNGRHELSRDDPRADPSHRFEADETYGCRAVVHSCTAFPVVRQLALRRWELPTVVDGLVGTWPACGDQLPVSPDLLPTRS